MDRYLVIENSPALANYYEKLSDVVCVLGNPFKNPMIFKDAAQVLSNQPNAHPLHDHGTTITTDTSRLIGISAKETSLIRQDLFPPSPKSSVLLSPYLNITDDLAKQMNEVLLDTHLEILTSSIHSHGFFNASGLAGIIPALYEALKYKLLRETNLRPMLRTDDLGKEHVMEYSKPGWSFHGKGIVFFYRDKVALQFGSSNFGTPSLSLIHLDDCGNLGYRSSHRDIENVVAISSDDLNFRAKLEEVVISANAL